MSAPPAKISPVQNTTKSLILPPRVSSAPRILQGHGVPVADHRPHQLGYLRLLQQRLGLPHSVSAQRSQSGRAGLRRTGVRCRLLLWPDAGEVAASEVRRLLLADGTKFTGTWIHREPRNLFSMSEKKTVVF